MIIVAIIIVAMAVYVFNNFTNMNLTQGIILAVMGVIALFIVMGIIFLLYRGMTTKK